MLKTNSKAFMTWLKDYVVKNTLEPETETYSFKTIEEAALSLASQFQRESCEREVRSCGSYQEAFIWWTQGLPNPLFDFWNFGAVKLVGDALQQTPTERERFTDTDACRLLAIKIWMLVSPYFFKIGGFIS